MLPEAAQIRMQEMIKSACTTYDDAEGEYPTCISVLIQSADDALIALLPVNCELQSHDLPEVEFDDGTRSTRLARIQMLLESDPWQNPESVKSLREIVSLAVDLYYEDILDIAMEDYWPARYVLEAVANAARRQADALEAEIF
jgi:hypothetical protein